jgi:two-component system, OmpR family, phosphate regulon sensor histidine kinase PhoR
MKRHQSLQYMLIFILAQVAWLSLLGLWIYWYVSNYFTYSKAGADAAQVMISHRNNVVALVGGLILLVAVSVAMSLLFARLNSQLKVTGLYDNFIANVTHELKSPLASIQLYLETLNQRRLSREKQKEFLQIMMRDADRLNQLINSILEIAGLEQKKVAHDFAVYPVDTLARSLIKEAAEQFKLPPRAIRIAGHASCQCVADRNALKIVFNNLLDNAIKYSSSKARIDVRLKRTFKVSVIEFRDRGIGISANDQKKVFDKFLRIYNANVPNVKGTGLGLYWVKEIIKYHGGKVTVSSEGTNKGTTFRIELPIYRTSRNRRINQLLKITQRSAEQLGSGEGKEYV